MTRPLELAARGGSSSTWSTEILRRIRVHFGLKLVGISAFMWIFFIGYFHLLRNPVFAVREMPLTGLDHLIPFQPQWLAAYLSLWVYVGIAPSLLVNLRELIVYGLWAAALCLTGLACFYFWPTAVPPLVVDVSAYAGFAMLQGVDAAGNACPSLHVGSAMFSAIWIDHLLRRCHAPNTTRWINAAWYIAIAYSTLAIKQHVAFDALAGAILGVVVAAASLRWRARSTPGWAAEQS